MCVHITLVSVYLYCVLIGVCYDILCSGFSSRVDPNYPVPFGQRGKSGVQIHVIGIICHIVVLS